MRRLRLLLACICGMLALAGEVAATPARAQAEAEPSSSYAAPSRRVVRNVTIRERPTARSAAIGRLSPGERLPVVAVERSWIGVRLADGRTGWVSRTWTTVSAVPAIASARPFTVEAIDVGTGLAILIRGPDFTMLYDGGSNDDTALGNANRLVDFLEAVHPDLRRIDVLVLSHPHRDHVELLADVLDRYEVGSVWDSGRVNPICGYRAFMEAISARPAITYHDAVPGEGSAHVASFPAQSCHGVRLPAKAITIAGAHQIVLGETVDLGVGATMQVLAADGEPLADVNANSVVVRLRLGSRSVLLMGDAEAGGRRDPATAPDPDSIEGHLLACCRAELQADVLVAGHHGSRTSSRQALVDAVGAKDFVISAGPTRYATVVLPDADIVSELEARGRVWRTDLNDQTCGREARKVGRDADGQPGGCDNVRLTIGDGAVTGAYLEVQPAW